MPDAPAEPRALSLVIPNYNGEVLLRAYLPTVRAAVEAWGGDAEVIVVDDASRDGSCALVREQFPWVRLVESPVNGGFARACNRGFAAARHPLALCLNNDVRLTPGVLAPLLRPFADPSVFAVTPTIRAERLGVNQGVTTGRRVRGFIRAGFAPLDSATPAREILYGLGGCVVYDLAKLRALGGYLDLYTPYLFEDVDLSYRAWKRGWRSLHEPAGPVYHETGATLGRIRKRVNRRIYFRNRFLFHWINLTDPPWRRWNRFHTGLRLASSFLGLDLVYYQAFLDALRRRSAARAAQATVRATRVLTDREILQRTT